MVSKIREEFTARFGKAPLVAQAPGRVNLIGEHTDYNEGYVLPAAIDRKIVVAIAPNNSNKINIYAQQFNEHYSCSIDNIQPVKGWPTYLLGMFHHLQEMGHELGGVDVTVQGDIPAGAGMSSSAALCSAFGVALNELFFLHLSKMSIALTGQKTEHDFAGVQCGIMDEFASMHGRSGHLIKLDCRSLQYEFIPFRFPDHKIVLINTMVSHSLASTEYNLRREQCEEGVFLLQKKISGLSSLRDLSREQLQQNQSLLPPVVYKRCRFIVEENLRLLEGCQSLAENDLHSFGQLMFLAHAGLSKLYEVSCPESDFLVSEAKNIRGVIGSRQMGGGFGGCTINIVEAEFVGHAVQALTEAYQRQFNIDPESYVMQIESGASLLAD